jgi:hypothetical protein
MAVLEKPSAKTGRNEGRLGQDLVDGMHAVSGQPIHLLSTGYGHGAHFIKTFIPVYLLQFRVICENSRRCDS